jgi:outer membrane beta-barrel protein
VRRAYALALVLGAGLSPAPARAAGPDDAGVCLDEDAKATLDAKRRTRLVKERLYQKTNRHELTVRGGHFVSDLFDATWLAGGAYTYYLTEDFAVEASGAYTRFVSRGGPELERTFEVLGGEQQRALLFSTNLVWAPLYAKIQSGGGVARFDVSLTVGAGVVDSALSSGVAGNAGIGFGVFLGRAVVVRLDVRDHVYRQQLLARKVLVNDLSVTLGLGILLPFEE